ncbi:depupylase/deamidase Dop [Corynebacterium pygosceleis]|uniref:Depupylase/deamidase Dop n=1 Tax=Corynebacterium pygosceleis TaxID=2800406 RepID=A0A9Q4C6X2_9CORY|nr:depupylase/deamidase Dop [Corynebacterium pygosceleis]MCK7637054.1 proteasome accessory factor PafA2 [Corynebacterium pygosceleis]MCL0120174.1 proteasome accessory factor PafA2 [Corynebacterium pygosceleis]MCX7467807.1 depupylase/deamidase Dop [Corynebacterium pygosceleis]
MPRFIGSETEYGIATPADPTASPIITSTHAVLAYAVATGASLRRTRWNFGEESPLRDARGFDLRRFRTAPVIDPNTVGVANVITSSGARFYVDHAHPEYSAPETTDAMQAVIYDAAGDLVMNRAVDAVHQYTDRGESVIEGQPPCPALKVYKNNVDGKGASYGSHENYRWSRSTDFDVLTRAIIPFFVTRQVLIGAGRVGLGERGESPGFQISQRADYIEQPVSLETTLNRGIVNTRDEPHADADRWGRLHVIIGDANMSQTSNLLKFGLTSLVLDAIEAGEEFSDLGLADPVAAVKQVSRDLDCRSSLRLADGRELRATAILREYLSRCSAVSDTDELVLRTAEELLDDLDVDPLRTADRLDWTAKWSLIRRFTDRGLDIGHPKIALVDLQYADIDPDRGLHHALVRRGSMRTFVDPTVIDTAALTPPTDTRAFFRGEIMRRWPDQVLAASWDTVVVSGDRVTGHHRLRMPELDCLTRERCGDLFDRASDAAELLRLVDDRGLATVDLIGGPGR